MWITYVLKLQLYAIFSAKSLQRCGKPFSLNDESLILAIDRTFQAKRVRFVGLSFRKVCVLSESMRALERWQHVCNLLMMLSYYGLFMPWGLCLKPVWVSFQLAIQKETDMVFYFVVFSKLDYPRNRGSPERKEHYVPEPWAWKVFLLF